MNELKTPDQILATDAFWTAKTPGDKLRAAGRMVAVGLPNPLERTPRPALVKSRGDLVKSRGDLGN